VESFGEGHANPVSRFEEGHLNTGRAKNGEYLEGGAAVRKKGLGNVLSKEANAVQSVARRRTEKRGSLHTHSNEKNRI